MYGQKDMDTAVAEAVEKWNLRDARNLDLYLAGEADNLNRWPGRGGA